jgi:hypothetical protein
MRERVNPLSTIPPVPLRGSVHGTERNGRGYTLGQAAKAGRDVENSILRSIKAGRISAGRDEFGQWAIELVSSIGFTPITNDNDTGNGTGERAVTGGDTALLEANARASLLEHRIGDLRTILDDMRGQRDDFREQRDAWQRQAEASQRALTDQREKAAARQSWWAWLRSTG